MDGGEKDLPSFWVDESQELLSVPMKMKRKARTKKMEFVGWGSKPLIEFLESIGKDTSKQISQYEMTSIINEYVNTNNLINPQKKKRIMCDERLHYLFGKKSLVRIKIYDLLETHFAENQDESEDGFFYSSEDNNEATLMVREQQKASASDRKHLHQRKKVPETPKSCFAAIILANIKLVYLKRSLVLDLQKDPETFEGKVVGSFVRVKSDPNDYFQKNSHQLLQVSGVRKDSGTDNTCTVCLLQVSNVMKDIHISMLSDDNFSEEECEDVRQRVKNGSLKRPTVVEFQEKAQILHEDITKHWLVSELTLLQNLIDRANEKGWRRELDEYLNKRQLLQSPSEQSRLLLEVPKVIAEEIEQEATLQEGTNGSPRSILGGASEISTSDLEVNPTLSTQKFGNADAAGSADILTASIVVSCYSFLARDESKDFASEDASIEVPKADENNAEGQPVQFVQKMTPQINLEEPKVIELSNDDDYNDREDGDSFGRSIWHYMDSQGNAQGPFPVESLKRWSDANYFPPGLKVWKTGQSHEEAVLLSHVLLQMFHDSYE